MTSSKKSLQKAEQTAMAGEDDESEESQMLLRDYMLRYGVGLTSSSPAPEGARRPSQYPQLPVQDEPGNKQKVVQSYVGSSRHRRKPAPRSEAPTARRVTGVDDSRASNTSNATGSGALEKFSVEYVQEETGVVVHPNEQSQALSRLSPALEINDEGVPVGNSTTPGLQAEAPNTLVKADVLPRSPRSPRSSVSHRRKMSSSQSPTQSNDGRSYERYLRESSPAHDEDHIPSTDPGDDLHERSLNEDDTGAVNFVLGDLGRPDTQSSVPDGSGKVVLGVAPFFPHSQDNSSRASAAFLPETPAAPKNPFTASDHTTLLGGSQLFGQTQFSSAARRVSPTSSRPSPNNFPANSISPNPIISSPLKTRGLLTSPSVGLLPTSSPQLRPGTTSSRLHDDGTTPFKLPPARVPESPQLPPRARKFPEPIAEYVPMRKSQERRETSDPQPSGSEDSDDSEYERRRRVQRKKQEAAKLLSSISISRPSLPESVEVPATNKKRRKSPKWTQDRVAQSQHAKQDAGGASQDDAETVADSQELAAQQREDNLNDDAETDAGEVEEIGPDEAVTAFPPTGSSAVPSLPPGTAPGKTSSNEEYAAETIPETSPTENHSKAFSIFPKPSSGIISNSNAQSDLSQSRSRPSGVTVPDSSTATRPVSASQASAARPPASNDGNGDSPAPTVELSTGRPGSSPALPPIQQLQATETAGPESSSPPAFSTRARRKAHGVLTSDRLSAALPSSARNNESTSALSSLTATPVLSHETTPMTDDDVGEEHSSPKTSAEDENTPAMARARRRQVPQALPKLKIVGSPVRSEASSRPPAKRRVQSSSSTDELARSPASIAPAFEQSLLRAPKSAASRLGGKGPGKTRVASREPSVRGGGLFEGMAFAISFQSRKPGESADQFKDRMEHAKIVEKKIQQAGGRVLTNGFDELFDNSSIKSALASPSTASSQGDSEISLLPSAAATGFAALIADGHSRKVKYMQALALGLPCIAVRWITTCLDKDRLIDWSPYLLCAGQSTFLDGAIRSRNLAPYEASTARLADVVRHRPKLLEGSIILLVMRKSEEGKKMAYVFLARILGATLCRVHSIDEARAKLMAMEDLGRPYDWVYVDGRADEGEKIFKDAAAPETTRKRKRASSSHATGAGAGAGAGRAPKRIRILSDELVIQSLILGRLMDEDEMGE